MDKRKENDLMKSLALFAVSSTTAVSRAHVTNNRSCSIDREPLRTIPKHALN